MINKYKAKHLLSAGKKAEKNEMLDLLSAHKRAEYGVYDMYNIIISSKYFSRDEKNDLCSTLNTIYCILKDLQLYDETIV